MDETILRNLAERPGHAAEAFVSTRVLRAFDLVGKDAIWEKARELDMQDVNPAEIKWALSCALLKARLRGRSWVRFGEAIIANVMAMSFKNMEEAVETLDEQLDHDVAERGRTLLLARLSNDSCHALLHVVPESVHQLFLPPYHVMPSSTAWEVVHQPLDTFLESMKLVPL